MASRTRKSAPKTPAKQAAEDPKSSVHELESPEDSHLTDDGAKDERPSPVMRVPADLETYSSPDQVDESLSDEPKGDVEDPADAKRV